MHVEALEVGIGHGCERTRYDNGGRASFGGRFGGRSLLFEPAPNDANVAADLDDSVAARPGVGRLVRAHVKADEKVTLTVADHAHRISVHVERDIGRRLELVHVDAGKSPLELVQCVGDGFLLPTIEGIAALPERCGRCDLVLDHRPPQARGAAPPASSRDHSRRDRAKR